MVVVLGCGEAPRQSAPEVELVAIDPATLEAVTLARLPPQRAAEQTKPAPHPLVSGAEPAFRSCRFQRALVLRERLACAA